MKFACVGDNCIDWYVNTKALYCGGNPVNVAAYAIRGGDSASYVGAVGSDEFGQFMLQSLNAHQVDTSHVQVLPGKTAVSRINLVDGERVFCGYDEGVLADFRLTDADLAFIRLHDLLVTGRWGKIQNRLAEIKANGTPIAFDFATKLGDEIFLSAIDAVDYAFFSREEDSPQVREEMRMIHSHGTKIAVCTLGEHGSLAFDGKDFFTHGIEPCEVKDTMGAGDSYMAGFLHGVLRHLPVTECMRLGAVSSSLTLQYYGAW